MVEQESSQWKLEIIQEIKHVTPQQLWPLIADFCSVNKLFSHLKSYIVEGAPGEPGVVRCVESSTFSSGQVQFAKEKLVMIDPTNMSLTYEVLENNAGFKYYVGNMQLFPIDNEDGNCGCKFVWNVVADPVQGFTQEDFFGVLKSMAQAMAKKMEDDFSQD